MLQPLADAIKLICKNIVVINKRNRNIIMLSPIWALTLAVYAWLVLPTRPIEIIYPHRLFLLVLISRMTVYPILLAGWASNSKYRFIGALRGIAQTISYEVRIVFSIVCVCLFFSSIRIHVILYSSIYIGILIPWVFCAWIIIILAETNRAPFDLVEGERELVRGFNTEYRGPGFTILFISEYLHIVVLRVLTRLLFLGGIPWLSMAVIALFILSRATLPRIRVDYLISLTWTSLLPITLCSISLCVRIVFISSTWHRPPLGAYIFKDSIEIRFITWPFLYNLVTCARFQIWHPIGGEPFVSPWDTWWYFEFGFWIIMLNKLLVFNTKYTWLLRIIRCYLTFFCLFYFLY